MRRRHFLSGLVAAPLLAACAGGFDTLAPKLDATTMSGTLIVLRHAEQAGDGLSAEGAARAEAMAEAMAGVEIDGIYTPAAQASIETARPLAQAKGLEIQVIPAVDVARTIFGRQPGGTLVWIGSDDDLAPLWEEIGAGGAPPANPGEMFFVAMNGLRASGVERDLLGG